MMDTNERKEFTVQGADPPVPVGSVSERAGSTRRLSSVCSPQPVGDQAGAVEKVTGNDDDLASEKDMILGSERTADMACEQELIFGRRSSLRRTPPKEDMAAQRPLPGATGKDSLGDLITGKRGRIGSLPDIQKEGCKDRIDGQGQAGTTESFLFNIAAESMEVFGSRSSLPRSPPQGPRHSRLNLVSQLKRCNSFNTGKKRKILDSSMQEEYYDTEEGRRSEDPVVFVLAEAIELLTKCSRDLDTKVAEFPNTQKDIKQIVLRVRKGVEVLNRETSKVFLQKHKWRALEPPKYDADTQTEACNKLHTDSEKSAAKKMVDSGTQTERSAWQVRNENLASTIKKRMAKNRGYEGYKCLPTDSWPEEVYTSTREAQGNPLWNGSEADVLLIIDKGKEEGNKGIARQASRRFPELFDMQGDMEEKKGCITMVYEARILSSQEQKDEMGKRTVSRVWVEEEEMNTYMNLLSLKENIDRMGITRMAALVSMERLLQVRRMCEHIFCGSEVKVLLYAPTKKSKATNKDGKMGSTLKTSARSKNKAKRTDAVIVSMPGKSFEDLLSTVKERVDVRALGITVKGAASTRKGDLLLTLDRGGGADRLKEEIKDKIRSDRITVRTGNEQKKVNIRGLDAMAKEQDIAEAVRAALPEESMARIKVRSVYPAFGRRQNAVVEVDSADGAYLLRKGMIQVGWASCKIQERVEVRRCPKCWGFGHGSARCRGPDRSALCLKCGREGHKVKDCGEDAFCPTCNRAGHRADSIACPVFRAQLERVRSLSIHGPEQHVENDGVMEQDRVKHLEEEGLRPND